MLARAICLRLLEHLARAAASRTFWTAGRSRPIRIAMIAITTSSSISVKPRRRVETADMDGPLRDDGRFASRDHHRSPAPELRTGRAAAHDRVPTGVQRK